MRKENPKLETLIFTAEYIWAYEDDLKPLVELLKTWEKDNKNKRITQIEREKIINSSLFVNDHEFINEIKKKK
jgi:hypothetical protein